MATLTLQEVATTGLAPSYVAAAGGGDAFDPRGSGNNKVFLHVKNGDAAPITVTITDVSTPAPVGAVGFDADLVVTVGATDEKMIAIKPLSRFTDPDTRLVSVAYSAVASVTVAALRVP